MGAARRLVARGRDPAFGELVRGALDQDVGAGPSYGLTDTIAALRLNHQYHLAMLLIETALGSWNVSLRELAGGGPLPIAHLTAADRALLEELLYEAGVSSWYVPGYRELGLAISGTPFALCYAPYTLTMACMPPAPAYEYAWSVRAVC